MPIDSLQSMEEWELASSDPEIQNHVDERILLHAGKRVRLTIGANPAPLEYVGRVPRKSELSRWTAPARWGGATILARPGSHDPANPISPQLHYLKILDGEWCMVRLRVQDSDPLEIRRLGRTIHVALEALDERHAA